MSGTEEPEPAGTDPIDLQLPRGAAGSSRVRTTEQAAPQTSTTPVTRLIDTKKFVASDSIPWGQGKFLCWKWSFLNAVCAISKPLYEGFKKIEENMSQNFRKSRLSSEDLELADQAYTLLALLCRNEACLCKISGRSKWLSSMASLPESTSSSERDNPLEPVTGTNLTTPDPRINLRQ